MFTYSDIRGAVIGVGPMASLLIRAAAGRVRRVFVLFPFFPPRSDTSHRSPCGDLAPAFLSPCDPPSLADAGATGGHSVGRAPILRLTSGCFPLCTPRARATPFAAGANCYRKRASGCTNCKRPHTHDSDNPPGLAWANETRGPGFSLRCRTDSGVLSDESVFQSMPCWLGRLTVR
jgi:hypothetical protein